MLAMNKFLFVLCLNRAKEHLVVYKRQLNTTIFNQTQNSVFGSFPLVCITDLC